MSCFSESPILVPDVFFSHIKQPVNQPPIFFGFSLPSDFFRKKKQLRTCEDKDNQCGYWAAIGECQVKGFGELKVEFWSENPPKIASNGHIFHEFGIYINMT